MTFLVTSLLPADQFVSKIWTFLNPLLTAYLPIVFVLFGVSLLLRGLTD